MVKWLNAWGIMILIKCKHVNRESDWYYFKIFTFSLGLSYHFQIVFIRVSRVLITLLYGTKMMII